MPEQKKREIAYKVRINDVLKGEYVKRDGWDPNFVMINSKQVSRVNIMGVIVSTPDAGQNSLTVDDGSGRIEVRSFDSPEILAGAAIGDIVLLVGKPREYNNARYIVAEILRKIENKKWMEVRKLELESSPPIENAVKAPPAEAQTPPPKSEKAEQPIVENEQPEVEAVVESPSESVYDIIKKLDKGDGAPTEEVIKSSDSPDAEKRIENLLKDGEIFEPSPGRLKVLE